MEIITGRSCCSIRGSIGGDYSCSARFYGSCRIVEGGGGGRRLHVHFWSGYHSKGHRLVGIWNTDRCFHFVMRFEDVSPGSRIQDRSVCPKSKR